MVIIVENLTGSVMTLTAVMTMVGNGKKIKNHFAFTNDLECMRAIHISVYDVNDTHDSNVEIL